MKPIVAILLIIAALVSAVLLALWFIKRTSAVSREKQQLIREYLAVQNRFEQLENHPEQTQECEQKARRLFFRNVLLYQHLIAASESSLPEEELSMLLSETAVNYGDSAHALRTSVAPEKNGGEGVTYETLSPDQRKELLGCPVDELRTKIKECSDTICKRIPFFLILEQTGVLVAEETAALCENRFCLEAVRRDGAILAECLEQHGILRKYYEDFHGKDDLEYTFAVVYPGELAYPGLFMKTDCGLQLLERGAFIEETD